MEIEFTDEALKELKYWQKTSRRIDNTNRFVYRFDETVLTVISLRYHYKK